MEFADLDQTVLRSPKFMALSAGCFVALVSFASMSSAHGLYGSPADCGYAIKEPTYDFNGDIKSMETITDGDSNHCKYSQYSEFKYLVTMGVFYWLYSLGMMGLYLTKRFPQPVTEFGCSAVFAVLIFFAFFVGAQKCNDKAYDTKPVCHESHSAKAGVAFAFFEWIIVTASAFLTFREWRDVSYEGLPETVSSAFSTSSQSQQQPYGGPPGSSPVIAASTQTYG